MTANDPLDDSLEGMFGPPTGEPAPARPAAPAWAVEADERVFTENCPKCRGTGRFGNYGRCFTCKGTGTKSFKTSREGRERNRQQAQARTERRLQETMDTFAAAHPAIHAWLVEAAPTFPFAQAMLEAVTKWGSLTERQLAACQRSVDARANRASQRAEAAQAAPVADVAAIERAFDNARAAGIRSPKLRLDAFTFKPAKATSANAGAIYVTEGETYLGKVAGGKFLARRECTEEKSGRIVAACADPHNAAKAYGQRFGSCAVCGRELTKHASIDLGIGPICAARFGWGA